MNTQPVSYLQTDPRWKSIPYAVGGESATIGGSGCGPTAMAMVLATWVDKSITPKSECAWALKNGFKCKGHGTFYGYFAKAAARFGLTCTQINYATLYKNGTSSYHTQVRKAIAAGELVIACMGPGNWTSGGHFVLVWDIDEAKDIVYINDPASTKTTRTRGSYKLFRTQVKYYFIIKRPANASKNTKEETEMSDAEIRKLVEDTVKAAVQTAIQNALTTIKAETAMAPEPDWSEKEGAWKAATDAGIVDGTRPRSEMTRAEVVAVLKRLGLF